MDRALRECSYDPLAVTIDHTENKAGYTGQDGAPGVFNSQIYPQLYLTNPQLYLTYSQLYQTYPQLNVHM